MLDCVWFQNLAIFISLLHPDQQPPLQFLCALEEMGSTALSSWWKTGIHQKAKQKRHISLSAHFPNSMIWVSLFVEALWSSLAPGFLVFACFSPNRSNPSGFSVISLLSKPLGRSQNKFSKLVGYQLKTHLIFHQINFSQRNHWSQH